jgi:hypothetical protein
MILKNLAEAAAAIPCTERWLADQLRAGRFPGHKVSRQWRLSDADIEEIIRLCAVHPTALPTSAPSEHSSMTPTTRRRLQQSQGVRHESFTALGCYPHKNVSQSHSEPQMETAPA